MYMGNFLYEQPKLRMTEKEFAKFRDLVYTRTHIFCADVQQPLFERKIRVRLAALDLSSFQEYYDFITDRPEGEQEFTRLIDIIAVHETSFFRIHGHFNGLRQRIFPDLFRPSTGPNPSSPIRIWSAGCSTGEEPYSIVMTFLEILATRGLQPSNTRGLHVMASDISPSVIEKARKGIYSSKQIQKIQQPLLDKYFICRNNQYYITQQIKEFVTFDVFNLIDLATIPQDNFDVIFCRNVLIYFDRHAQTTLLEGLIALLPEGGCLFLGDAESIHTFPESARKLEFIETENAIIYQKRGVDLS